MMQRLCLSRFFNVLAFCLLASFAGPALRAADPIELPDSIAGKRLAAFFEAYSSGTEEAFRSFESQHRVAGSRTVEERVAQSLENHKRWGTLTPRLKLYESEHKLCVLAESSGKVKWFRCEVMLEAKAPYRLIGVAILQAGKPELFVQHYGTRDYSSVMDKLARAADVPGLTIATIREGRIATSVTGVRRLGSNELVRKTDRFHWGSVTKSATAVTMGSLVEAGRLSWDQKIGTLLPKLEMRAEYREVTLEQLLQHRSGLPPYRSSDDFRALPEKKDQNADANAKRIVELRRLAAAKALAEKPVFVPGTETRYSNAGYVVAGAIIDQIGLGSWEKEVVARVLEPLKLSTAGFGWPMSKERPEGTAGHYEADDGTLRPQNQDDRAWFQPVNPAGGVHSSVEDFARYAQFHLDGLRGGDGILKAKTLQRIHTPIEGHYASGWFVQQFGTPRQHFHGGSGGTFMAFVLVEPASNTAVALMANAARRFELEAMAKSVADVIRQPG